MQTFKNLVLEANKHLRLADHMAYVTYPMLKDTKLLISVMDNLDKSLKKALDAYLYYERLYKRISFFPEDLNSKLDVFERSAAIRYDLKSYTQLIRDVHHIMQKHRESPVEFVKNGKLVICYEDYKFKVLEFSDVKIYITKAKPFIFQLSDIIKKDEFNRRGLGRD